MTKVKKEPGSPRTPSLSIKPGKKYLCTPLKPYNDTKEKKVAVLGPPSANNKFDSFKEPYNINQEEKDCENKESVNVLSRKVISIEEDVPYK